MLRLIVAVFYTTPRAAMSYEERCEWEHPPTGRADLGPPFSVIAPPARGNLGEPPGVLVAVLGHVSECLSPINTPQSPLFLN